MFWPQPVWGPPEVRSVSPREVWSLRAQYGREELGAGGDLGNGCPEPHSDGDCGIFDASCFRGLLFRQWGFHFPACEITGGPKLLHVISGWIQSKPGLVSNILVFQGACFPGPIHKGRLQWLPNSLALSAVSHYHFIYGLG